MSDTRSTEKSKHRKSGAVQVPVDAFWLTEWVSRVLREEGQDRFGRSYHVEVEVTIRDIGGDTEQEQNRT